MTPSKVWEERIATVQEFLATKIKSKTIANKLAEQIVYSAADGLELQDDDFDTWFKQRFTQQLVWLSSDDYATSLARALWLAPHFAGTDFGTSRQRDIGQAWTDTARGFMGEAAVSKFLFEHFKMEIPAVTRRGKAKEFISTDIEKLKLPDGHEITPKLTASIKTGKFNSRWLDAGGQFEHSDIFIAVKVGVARTHFISFLKDISFFKDKLFPKAVSLQALSEAEAKTLWDEVPIMQPIPAYIPGYINKTDVHVPIDTLHCKIKGKKNKKISVTQAVGVITLADLRSNPKIQALDPTGTLPIEIEPMIGQLGERDTHFLAHCGGLRWGKQNWEAFVKSLIG